jgi:hypothetical protein
MKSNEVEPANRAEVTALLINAGYRVYRPEADIDGEDLILCTLAGRLVRVQQKPCLSVDHVRYEKRDLWMLFPDPSLTLRQKGLWAEPAISSDLRQFRDPIRSQACLESEGDAYATASTPDEMSLV